MTPQEELQKVIYDALTGAPAVMALVSGVFDRVPADPARWGAREAYISFGAVDVVEDDADCIVAAVHTVQVDCWSRKPGKVHCKRIVDAVKGTLHDLDAAMTTNALVEMRVTGRRVFLDADGITTHGVVTIEAMIEENS